MPQVGFEPTTPVFEREETVCASDCVATVLSILHWRKTEFCEERAQRSLTFIVLYFANYEFLLGLCEVRLFVGLKRIEAHGLWDELDYVL
jgi:hypothetical protein